METDLLFALIPSEDWKKHSSRGQFEPDNFEEDGFIRCYKGDQVQDAANEISSEIDNVALLVIDPLKVQIPIKYEVKEGVKYPVLHGTISIEAIIDRIQLSRDKKGRFNIRVKHFD